ncbi:MAG: T9SS type A sorting domain-containing protein [Candidatus Marinimicrobia bacterium]|nr:T9SS type A sorting domain-containing protein [Candidatus Neomarinimicrobiota bacterium]
MRFAFIDPDHVVNFVRANLNVADGQWHYLAGVRDAVTRELRLYIDGRQEAMPATFPNITSFSQFWSGTISGVGSLPEPVATAASDQTDSSATLHGTVNPNNFTTNVAFEYGLTNSFGNETALENPLPAGLAPVTVSAPATGLLPDTTYLFRIRAENIAGPPEYSSEQTFRTLPAGSAPELLSDSPAEISDTTALLEAMVNPNKQPTSVRFDYGPTAAYGNSVSVPDLITGDSPQLVTALLEDLVPDALYHYRVVATNERGGIPGRDTTFTTTDTQAPAIQDLAMTPETVVTAGQEITVSATITDRSGAAPAAKLFFKVGSGAFQNVTMTNSGNIYTGLITQDKVTLNGVVWYVSATDPQVNKATTDTFYVAVEFGSGALTTALGAQSAFPQGIPEEKWRLFSIPADLALPQLSNTIADELGAQSETTWKVFGYQAGAYQENPSILNPGDGYWINQRVQDGLVFAVGAGQTNDLESFLITLKPGWNIIGTPYPFPISIDLDQGLFHGPFTYGINGEGWWPAAPNVVTTLKPWGGYIVYNRSATDDRIITLSAIAAPGAVAKVAWWDPDGWLLRLKLKGRTYTDNGSIIGRLAGATESLDRFDNPEPPYVDGYVSLAMERPEWGDRLPRFTTDIRDLDVANGIWELGMRIKGERGPVELTPRLSGELPANTAVLLVDLLLRKQYDLLDAEVRVTLTDYREQFPYHLKVVAGDAGWALAAVEEIFAALPEEFALSQNYPNPFNPSTTIEYALPRPARISLRIYDLLGRELVILDQGWRDMGYHQVVWNGRDRRGANLASGVYFAVFQADRTIRTRKMLLLK